MRLFKNQLIEIKVNSSTIAQYKYDGLGRRIEKSAGGNTTRYVYDGEDILLEYNGSNVLQAGYTHGPGIDEPLIMERGGSGYFYHADGLGSVTDLTNSSGAVVRSYVYDSFGNVVLSNGSLTNPYTYTGRELDAESGLYYYRARYYDPTIGRFLQRDPIGYVDSLNLYGYVNNNPINNTDPNGKWIVQVAGGLIGGTVNAALYYDDFKSGKISRSDYAKLIGVGAVSGVVSTLGGGIASGALLGGVGSATNNIAAQKIINKCEDINVRKVGEAFVSGAGVGVLGGFGARVGQNIIKMPDEIIAGGSPVINYGKAGGLIGDTVGTLITSGGNQK